MITTIMEIVQSALNSSHRISNYKHWSRPRMRNKQRSLGVLMETSGEKFYITIERATWCEECNGSHGEFCPRRRDRASVSDLLGTLP